MVRGPRTLMLDAVPRIVLTWDRPQHLAREEADRWLREELRACSPSRRSCGSKLVRLDSPLACHPQPFTWLCELHLAEDADVGACLARPPARSGCATCASWACAPRSASPHPMVLP